MRDLVVSLAVGVSMGVIFAVMRLPIPAPPTLAGVVGVLGVFIGYRIVRWLL